MPELSARIFQAFRTPDPGFPKTDALADRWRGLQPFSSEELAGLSSFDDDFEARFVYHSNGIEGSTLTMSDTALVLNGGFVPDRPGTDYFAARGSADGMAFYKKALAQGRTISEDLVKDIHERTTLDCQPATRGLYRQHRVYIRGSQTSTAEWDEIRPLMAALITDYNESEQSPIYKSAAFHASFENIHPFARGNGSTGRLLMNYMLEQAGYPPIAIAVESKAAYFTAMEDWQVRDDREPLLSIVTTNIESELNARIDCVMATRSPHEPTPGDDSPREC